MLPLLTRFEYMLWCQIRAFSVVSHFDYRHFTQVAFAWLIIGKHMTPSVKPEVHCVLQRHQRRIEP